LQKWREAVADYGHVITPETTDAELLSNRARAQEALMNWDAAAAADWSRAAAADESVLAKLAAAYQAAGRTREAVPHLVTRSAADPTDALLFLKVTALQAWFGQEEELAASRRRILAAATGIDDAMTAERAAKACSIIPSPDKTELAAALVLAQTAVKVAKGGEWNLLALGIAEYRSGNYAAADEALLAASKAGPDNPHITGTSAFYRAMSLSRQGKQDEARTLAITAEAKMKPLPKDATNPLAGNANHDDLSLWLAYKEAKALIKFDAATAAPERELLPPPGEKPTEARGKAPGR
jgi:tetratricopeptide (TPR) repeat protein